MNQIPINDGSILDLNLTNLDISFYIKDTSVPKRRVQKKRNSVIILNLKNEMEKNSRFVSTLCPRLNKNKKRPTSSVLPNQQHLKIPSALSQIDLNSEITCPTPLRNELLRIIPSPMTISMNTSPKLLSLYTSSNIQEKPKRRSTKKKN